MVEWVSRNGRVSSIQVDEGITLKLLGRSDTSTIFNAIDSQRAYLAIWLPFVEYTKDISHTEKFVDSVVNTPEEKLEYTFTIRKNGEFAGLIGFKETDVPNKKTELGYWLSEKFQKQGIMTKSVQKLCEFAFDALQLNRVQIKCAAANHPSKNIPRRLGFKLEGIERDGELLTGGKFTNLEIYSLVRSDVDYDAHTPQNKSTP